MHLKIATHLLSKNISLIATTSKYHFSSIQDLHSAQKYVNQNFRKRNWSTYLLSSYYPSQLRTAFSTFNLFDAQLIKVADNSKQPALALGKAQFWRTTVSKIYSKEKPNAQPISICLDNVCNNHPITKGYLLRLIDARSYQITHPQFQTMDIMMKIAQNSQSTIIALFLQILRIQIKNEEMERVIGLAGRAIGICDFLKRVPYGLRNYKFLLPNDILSKNNLQPKGIWDRVRGKPSQLLFDCVLQIASYAKKSLQQAIKIYESNQEKFPEHFFRAFLRCVQTEMYLINLEKYNFNLFQAGLNSISPIKLPYRVFNAAKAKKFYTGDLSKL